MGNNDIAGRENGVRASPKFSLTVDQRDYIFNESFCLQNERKGANRWRIPNRVSPNPYPHRSWKGVGGKCGRK
jgi:hypothetical protein